MDDYERIQDLKFHQFPKWCEEDEGNCMKTAQYIIEIHHKYLNPDKVSPAVTNPGKEWYFYAGLCAKHVKGRMRAEQSSARWHNKQPADSRHKQSIRIAHVWKLTELTLELKPRRNLGE
jgi:hypothetical protein